MDVLVDSIGGVVTPIIIYGPDDMAYIPVGFLRQHFMRKTHSATLNGRVAHALGAVSVADADRNRINMMMKRNGFSPLFSSTIRLFTLEQLIEFYEDDDSVLCKHIAPGRHIERILRDLRAYPKAPPAPRQGPEVPEGLPRVREAGPARRVHFAPPDDQGDVPQEEEEDLETLIKQTHATIAQRRDEWLDELRSDIQKQAVALQAELRQKRDREMAQLDAEIENERKKRMEQLDKEVVDAKRRKVAIEVAARLAQQAELPDIFRVEPISLDSIMQNGE